MVNTIKHCALVLWYMLLSLVYLNQLKRRGELSAEYLQEQNTGIYLLQVRITSCLKAVLLVRYG